MQGPTGLGDDRLNVDEAAKAAVRARELGIPALAIFPHIDAAKKNEGGDEAINPDGLIPTVIQAIKAAAPEVGGQHWSRVSGSQTSGEARISSTESTSLKRA